VMNCSRVPQSPIGRLVNTRTPLDAGSTYWPLGSGSRRRPVPSGSLSSPFRSVGTAVARPVGCTRPRTRAPDAGSSPRVSVVPLRYGDEHSSSPLPPSRATIKMSPAAGGVRRTDATRQPTAALRPPGLTGENQRARGIGCERDRQNVVIKRVRGRVSLPAPDLAAARRWVRDRAR
jgi:hypothetical protein